MLQSFTSLVLFVSSTQVMYVHNPHKFDIVGTGGRRHRITQDHPVAIAVEFWL